MNPMPPAVQIMPSVEAQWIQIPSGLMLIHGSGGGVWWKPMENFGHSWFVMCQAYKWYSCVFINIHSGWSWCRWGLGWDIERKESRIDPPLQSPVRLNCVHSLNGHSPFLYIGLLYTVPTLPNHILGGLSFVLGQLLVIGSGYRCSVNSQVGEHP